MQKRILMLATSAFILAYGAATASAQQGPMMQPQAQTQQQQERPLQGAQTPRAGVEDYLDDDSGITGRHPGFGWRRYRDWGPVRRGFRHDAPRVDGGAGCYAIRHDDADAVRSDGQ